MRFTSEQWKVLSSLLDEALALPESERERWLEELAAGNAVLAPVLRAMFAQQSGVETGDYLDTFPKFATTSDAGSAPTSAVVGTLIGPYRLIRELGRGGMGVVWLAERADGLLKRPVALKLPHASRHGSSLADRFARERDILAALAHPHIARLYDAGFTAEGQPYLALEYVEGVPLTAHCDANRLGVRERIALFLQVLDAVQYAHAHLVVHRDLKPSNVLVTGSGQVQLLDFGIAKLLNQGEPDAAALTEVEGRALTLDYASPEQISRQPITTASDIYSLGVMLCELLVGVRPYRLKRASQAALEDAIVAADPARPSQLVEDAETQMRSATARRLAKALRGDLDTIVLKALKKAPRERYASADAFSQDLRRHLAGAPVLARPDVLAYRAGKFVRRNWIGVSAGTLIFAALAFGIAATAWEARVARNEADRAKAVQDFLIGLFNEADPAKAQGHDVSVRELLDRGQHDLASKLDDQPRLKLTLDGVLVELYARLASGNKALPLAEARRDLARRTMGARSIEYGDALYALAKVQGSIGSNEVADKTYEAALAVFQLYPAERRDELLLIPRHRAYHALNLHRSNEARSALLAMMPQLEAHFGAQSWEVVDAKTMLAASYSAEGDHASAASVYRQLEPMLEHPPPEHALDAATLRGNMGYLQWRAGQLGAAEQSLRRAILEFDRIAGPNNSVAIASERTLGTVLMDAGQFAKARVVLDEAGARAVRFHGATSAETALNQSYRLAPLIMTGHSPDAVSVGREAMTNATHDSGLTASEIASVKRRLALALVFSGKEDEALALLHELSVQEELGKDRGTRHATTLLYLAGALEAAGRFAEAAAAAHEAGELFGATPDNAVQQAKAQLTEALARIRAGDVTLADSLVARAEANLHARLEPDHPDFLLAQLVRAEALRAHGDSAGAEHLGTATRKQLKSVTGADIPDTLPVFF